ncbi:caspase activity and apoptosis inhibitor 1-like isoform X2 [Schistocerca nitens]|uniref:caspase activity and apoptosis inhibitor 1-like isoform X2 n=1 Tax=Schistocerca nitens TaxID=7011 RepID=UPI002117D387|nr:caspase activity and apoptosis inhibitor 1-like isoform X2 [Schistocerca nitens]
MKMSVPGSHTSESEAYSSSEDEESTDNADESSSSSEEELKPISSFINNRRKMLKVAFSAVSEDKLKAIVPPFLKDATLDELKIICYEELCSLTDEALKSILEGNNWDESSSSEDEKTTSSTEIGSHEPRTVCGLEAFDSEDTITSTDSKNKDILEIGISEEEVSHLLKEIPNSQHTSKDTRATPSPSHSVASVSDKKHDMSDDVSTIDKDASNIVEVDSDAPGGDSLELVELEHRARSIRSLIMQCDAERENVSEISDKSAGIGSTEFDNRKHNILDSMTVTQKHQELDPLFLVCASGSKVVLTPCKKSGTDLNCKSKLTVYERLGHNAVLVSGDYTVLESKIPENNSTGAGHENEKGGDNETAECDSCLPSTPESSCIHNSTGVESVFHNTGPLQITISALNGGSLSRKDLQTNSQSAEKMKEKNIHKVVETSKMCTKLRERIKRTQQLKKCKEDNIKAETIILGTVEEYKSLNTK